MAGALKHNKVASLPGVLEYDSVYMVQTGPGMFTIRVTNNSGAVTAYNLDAVTAAQLATALSGKQDKFNGTVTQYVRGNGTVATLDKIAVGLGNVDNTSDLAKPISTLTASALALKANDNAVIHTTGNETKDGVLTLTSSPVVPNATTAAQATAYGQLTSAISNVQTQIDALNTTAATGLKYKGSIDASTNPNFPAAAIGDVWIVQPGGKIGGAAGKDVSAGNMIVAKAATAAGTLAAVGANWTIIQSDLDQASEVVAGFTRYATNAESIAGVVTNAAVVPSGLEAKMNASAVRFDAVQTLTGPQKAQALANIGASGDANVMHLTGNETAAGDKTFTGLTRVKRGLANVSEAYLQLEPSDFGAGKHKMVFYHSSLGNAYDIVVTDDSVAGNLNFASAALTHNGNPLATQAWANANLATIGHTHTFASLTAKPTTVAGFGITDAYTKAETYNKSEVNVLTSWYANEW